MNTMQQPQLVPEPFCIISTDACQENPNKLFLGGVPPQATEKQLEEFFSQFGLVRDVRIVTDRITAECKGYGFVTFDEKEDIEHLVERKTIRMSGKKIRIRKAIRRNGSQFDHIHLPKAAPNANSENAAPLLNHQSLLPPIEETSAPMMIPSEVCTMDPVYIPLTPPATPAQMYESQNISNFSSNQLVMSPVPDIELLNQQCGLQLSSMTPWVQPNFPVFYMPHLPFHSNNANWIQY